MHVAIRNINEAVFYRDIDPPGRVSCAVEIAVLCIGRSESEIAAKSGKISRSMDSSRLMEISSSQNRKVLAGDFVFIVT